MTVESDSPISIDDYLTALAPGVWNDDDYLECPKWPGDAFAICCSLLQCSGAYSGIGTTFWTDEKNDEWEKETARLANEWRASFDVNDEGDVPVEVQGWWECVASCYALEVQQIITNPDLCGCLLRILAVCDEVFHGVGVVPFSTIISLSLIHISEPTRPY